MGMFGTFKKSDLIKITVKYCLKITFYISQGSAPKFIGEVVTSIIFRCQVSSGYRTPKIFKIGAVSQLFQK